MGVTVTEEGFSTREEAINLVEAQGLFFRDGAMESGDLEDVHWHKTSLKIYVLSGSFETMDAKSGSLLVATQGNLITIPSHTLHAARCPSPATYVVGFESEHALKNFAPETPDNLPS